VEHLTTTPRILVVDDEKTNRDWIVRLLEGKGCRMAVASNGTAALESVAADPPDLLLLDLRMPGLDGFEVAKRLKADTRTKAIPIVMITGMDDRDSRLRALGCGAEEFLLKPVDPDELWVRVRNLLKLKQYGDLLAEHAKVSDRKVHDATIKLREAYREITFTLTSAAEYRDESTGSHVRRVAHYAWEIASYLGLEKQFLDDIFFAAPMHDVGKIGIPDSILLKAGPLTADEWVLMQRHTEMGYKILQNGKTPSTRMGAEIALTHHERWDGTGYPQHLKGEKIPLSGRIMNICDQYDALRSERPYKPPFNHAKTMDILVKGDGRTQVSHFDPAVHSAFFRCAERFSEIYDSMQDEE
jgi:putative two-component system response regulator